MIQSPSKELTLIVYDTPKPPRYLKLNKVLIKYLIIIIPTLVISSISLSLVYSVYLKNKVNSLRSSEPKIIEKLKNETENLSTQISSLTTDNINLTKKLSKGSAEASPLSSLALFTPSLGMLDLTDKELLKIENISPSNDSQKITLSFSLANNSEQKLSGHLFIVQYQGNLIQFYPDSHLSEKTLRLEYSQGEKFSFSRFRPTVATFTKLKKTSARYKIFIFSKTGDLIGHKQVGPFNIE
ncbi:MAG: hypothetical protein OEW87_15410 [Flavobacteriaceae bacterium]|nr:hypothetical protein [Flavobacteriaceae bacterium]